MRLHRKPQVAALALVSFLAFAVRAQQPPPAHDPETMDTTTTEASSPAPPLTPEQIALLDRYLTNVLAQPIGKIDTRSAAAGQGIALQIAHTATLANGTALPSGARLTGHILRAHSYAEGGGAALLSIDINRAILKDGTTIPIRCVIRGVTATEIAATGMPDASQSGSRRRNNSASLGGPTTGATPLGNPTPMGSPIGADSSSGDIGNSPMGNGSSYPGSPTNPNSSRGTTSGSGISLGDPGIGGGPRPQLPNAIAAPATAEANLPVTPAGENIHDAPRATGIAGVMLSGASITGVSGTLSAYERNFALDSSTELTLGVITAQ